MAPPSSCTIDIDVSGSGSSNATGSARAIILLEKEVVSPGQNPIVAPVKRAKGIRDWAFEGQRLADFPRACRMTGFLVVGGFGRVAIIHDPQLERWTCDTRFIKDSHCF